MGRRCAGPSAWSIFPLSAGIFNVCWISLWLGGPFNSARIRRLQQERS